MKVKTPEEIERRRAQWRDCYHRNKEKNAESIRTRTKLNWSKNKDKLTARHQVWVLANPYSTWSDSQKEASRAKYRQWYNRNIEAERSRSRIKAKLRYPANRDKLLASHRIYVAKNKDKVRAGQRRYRLNNLEYKRKQVRDYHRIKRLTDPAYKARHKLNGKSSYQKNKVLIQARHKEWNRLHPGAQRHYSQKRRALEKGAAINLTAIKSWMQSVRSKSFASCYYCCSQIPTSNVHFDHMIALSKGGAHSVENLCVSCSACNLHKGVQSFYEWQPKGQAIFSL